MPFPLFHVVTVAPLLPWRAVAAGYLFANALIDVEVAVRWAMGEDMLHWSMHSWIGVVIVTLFGLIGTTRFALGALIGGVAHVALDSIVHADVYPFGLISTWRPLLGSLSWLQTEALCMAVGVAGILGRWIYLKARRQVLGAAASRP
jgi:hypothetical protein